MTETVPREDDSLKNPMRFAVRNRRIDLEEKLRHPDFEDKQVTEIELRDRQVYVHWEWAASEAEQTRYEVTDD